MWIEYGNEIYDLRNMYNIRVFDIPTECPQYATEEPIHLENFDDNYEEISSSLKNFDPISYYKIAPRRIKKCIKIINGKVLKKRNSQTFCYLVFMI